MANEQAAPTLRELLVKLHPGHRVAGTIRNLPLTGASLWWPSMPLPQGNSFVIVSPPVLDNAALREFDSLLSSEESRIVAIPESLYKNVDSREPHTFLVLPDEAYDPVELIGIISRLIEAQGHPGEQRLASLQRSLSQSLSTSDPVPDLVQRLSRACSATAAFIDRTGQAVHSTGPLPLALIFGDLSHTTADSQQFFPDGGWRGIAARVNDATEPEGFAGWLVTVSRRPDFPDTYSTAATHLAATLAEVVRRLLSVSREQEEAVRSALLDQAIALQPVRDDEELTRRITKLGIVFDRSPRIAVLHPGPRRTSTDRISQLSNLGTTVQQTFQAANIPALCSIRDDRITLLMQCSDKDLRRLLISQPDRYRGVTAGVGRAVSNAGEVAASFQDAQLALRILKRQRRSVLVMSYEDFDVAPRLFASVGLEQMQNWARSYLAPVESRPALMEGLRSYFDHEQNVNAAADALGIHHNSLRYRLTKIEELLDVSLKNPAALASVFLALTALELASDSPQAVPRSKDQLTSENDAGIPTEFTSGKTPIGVVRGPEK